MRRKFLTSLTSFVLAISIFLTGFTVAQAEIIDRIVAVVNKEVITLSELNDLGAPIFAKINEQAPASEIDQAMADARRSILDTLINRALIKDHAEENGISVADEEVNATIDNILQKNNLTREEFQRDLQRLGTSEAKYRETLRADILEAKLVSYEIRSKIVITDQMMQEYYDDSFTPMDAPDGYRIRQMGFAWGGAGRSDDLEAAKMLAEGIRKKVQAGEDFQQLARSFSDLPSAKDGGDIGILRAEEMAQFMRDAVLDLQPGEVSEIIETPAGLQFFMLVSSKQGTTVRQAPFALVEDEIREKLHRREMEKSYNEWVSGLREKAYIKELL